MFLSVIGKVQEYRLINKKTRNFVRSQNVIFLKDSVKKSTMKFKLNNIKFESEALYLVNIQESAKSVGLILKRLLNIWIIRKYIKNRK